MGDIKSNQSKLYKALQSVGFKDLGSEEQFSAKLQDAGNRQKLYSALQKQGFKDLGDYDSFESRIYAPHGPVRKDAGSGAATVSRPTRKAEMTGGGEATGTPAETGTAAGGDSSNIKETAPSGMGVHVGNFVDAIRNKQEAEAASTPPIQTEGTGETNEVGDGGAKKGKFELDWRDRAKAAMTLGNAMNAAERAKASVERAENSGKENPFGWGEAGVGHNKNLRKGGKKFNAESGQFEDSYVTTDGRTFTDIQKADNAQANVDGLVGQERLKDNMRALGMDVDTEKDNDEQLREAYKERMELERKISKARPSQAGRIARAALFGSGSQSQSDRDEASDYDNLLSAKRLLDRRIDALEAKRDDAGLWRGVVDVLSDDSSLSFGLSDLADAMQMEKIAGKLNASNGSLSSLSESEKILARNYLLNEQAQLLNQDNWWYNNAGRGLGQTLSFMKDFAVTGGGFAGIAKGGMALGGKFGMKAATKAFGNYMTKELGTKKILGKAIELTGKGVGLAAGAEVAGLALNNTVQAASSLADITNRQLGNLTFDKDGNLSFEGGQKVGEAIIKSQVERMGENASELVGLAFDAIPGIVGRVIEHTAAGKVLKKITDSKFWKGSEKALDYLGVQSVWGEGLEEEYGMARTEILNRLTDGSFSPEGSGFFDKERQIDTWKTVGLTSMILRVPSMIASGTQAANYYANKYNLYHSDNALEDAFGYTDVGFERYMSVKQMIDGADNTQIAGVLNNLMNNAELSNDEKRAMFMYASDLIKVRGFNIGNIVAAANGFKAPPRVAGYNVRGNVVEEVDEEGNVLSTHEYENRDDMKAGLYEMQQQRADKTLRDDLGILRARPNGAYFQILTDYLADNLMTVSEFEAILDKPSMERSDAEQQLVAPFAQKVHDAVYDKTMLHEEQSQQDGEAIADAESIDIESGNTDNGILVKNAWEQAQQARAELFDRNETLRQEVESREKEGLSAQEIIGYLVTFRRDDVQTVIDYYNQKARYEGYINRKEQKIEEEARNSRDRHTFKGTVDGNADLNNVYTITDGENEYYLVSGNVTTDGNGNITGSDSGLIIGMDLDGSFVNIGDSDGYQLLPSRQTLDQFEEAERQRLEVEARIAQPEGAGTVTGQSGSQDNAGGEAGGASTGGNEPPAAAPVAGGAGGTVGAANMPLTQPAGAEGAESAGGTTGTAGNVTIESVTDEDGVKRYERGVAVDDAIADMIADGLDVNEEADLAINEAQEELNKMGTPKTRAERVKNEARRKELQGVIDYYGQVKQRWEEVNKEPVDATPFIERINQATSKKKADEILNEALQAGVDPAEVQQVHTQKVSDLIAKDEERRRREEEITDADRRRVMTDGGTVEGRANMLDRKRVPSAEKRRKLAKLIYGDYFDDDFDAIRDVKELISSWLGKGRQLDPDSFGQELGWDMSVGKDAAKVSTMFAKRRENGGEGMLFNDFVHMVWEASGGRFDTEEIRNAVLEMFRGAQEKSDLTEYQLQSRIAEAEAAIEDERRRAMEDYEEGQTEDEVDLGEGDLPFPPADDETPEVVEPSGEAEGAVGEPDGEPSGTVAQSREAYLASHPLTEAQIMADTEATEDEKLNAIDFLRGEDDSAISRFYYDGIYNRAANTQPTQPEAAEGAVVIEKPETWVGKTFFTNGMQLKCTGVENGYATFDNLNTMMGMGFDVEKVQEWMRNGEWAVVGESGQQKAAAETIAKRKTEKPKQERKPAGEAAGTAAIEEIEVPTITGGTIKVNAERVQYSDLKKGDVVWYSGPETSTPISSIRIDGVDQGDVFGFSENHDIVLPKDRTYYREVKQPSTGSPAGTAADPMAAIEQAAQSFREEQKSKDQQDIDDALKEFNDFLDNAKGSGVLDKFMRKGLEGNDKAQASLLDAFTLTNDAQRMFLKDLLRLASKVGYAYIKSGVHDVQAWSKKMSDTIGRKLNEVLGWDDGIVGEFVDEVWNQKYTVDGERMRLSEHAERLKNDKGADHAVNEHKEVLQDEKKDVSLQQEGKKASVVQQQTEQLEGDSAAFAERQEKMDVLTQSIHHALGGAVHNENVVLKTMRDVKAMAEKCGLGDLSMTDLQELVETEVVNIAREIASDEGYKSDQQRFEAIVKLYQTQPTLSARDNDRINKQQYSTPAPMAFLMGLFLKPAIKSQGNGQRGVIGLEPSAGNGMLTIGLPKEGMHVNDIDEMRLSNLQKQGFGQVTSQDGLQPFGEKQYDVVVTNPPFGSVTPKVYDGVYEISALEHQMAINALESMKDDGRAAIIIGGNTEYNQNGSIKGKDRAFLNYLYAHYNVVDVINMDGKTLYSRQGTGFPVRMILINGRKTFNAKDFAPVQSKARAEQVKSYDELYKRVNDDILSNRQQPSGVHNAEGRESNGKHDNGHAGNTTQTGVRDVPAGGGSQQRGLLAGGGQRVSGSIQRTETSEGGGQRGLDADRQADKELGQGTPVVHGSGSQSSQPEGGTTSQADTGRGQRRGRELPDGRDNAERPDGGNDVPIGVGQRGSGTSQPVQQPEQKRGLSTEKVPYRKQSSNPFTLDSLMPAEQADEVKKILEELGDVDQFLVDELGYANKEELHKALAAEQIDSVAMAIHQMNQGNAFIIGDMTGIGKGRQAAALIRYAVRKGGNPVFITVKKGLFSDMYRDLCDIGSPGLRPFIWCAKDKDNSQNVTDEDGNVVYKWSEKEQKRVADYILKNGKLPPEYDYIVTTYDGFKSGTIEYENGQKKARNFGKDKSAGSMAINGQKKRDALEVLARNSYVIMDESHNAGGDKSNISKFLQYITVLTKGTTFLSATFAKRPENMPIYALRTAISKAGVKVDELIAAVKKGGATFQEVMSKALTGAGQMIRRERNMEGVTIDWKGIDDEKVIEQQRQQYDKLIGLFNDIINFQRTYVDPIVNGMNDDAAEVQGNVDHTPGTRDMGINNTPFASRTYNMVQQLLLSLKAQEAGKRAVEHLKAGRKPVIAVANTNEKAADEAVGMSEEDMEMPDLSVNMKKGLQSTLRITKKDAFGKEEQSQIPFESLSPEGQARYREIMDAIDNASSGLSLSPIDVIKNELKKAGYKVGELTGRELEFVYNADGTVKRVKRQDTDKKRTAADFNSGKLDALIINRSAGTGISLHASSKFKDQRQRIMIVAQAQGDVNDEVQMRGRIDRTGQVLRGMYEYVVSQIPSEQRLLMMLKAKLRSLDANTTSSQKSKFNEMQVQDIINKYGDDIVIQYLAEHPDLAVKMCDPLNWEGKHGEGYDSLPSETLASGIGIDRGEDGKVASKVLGRMALLKVKEQEKMLAEIGDLYQAEIDRLNEMGENDLEITEMPLRAKTLKKDVWEQGTEPGGKNPFADNTYVEKVEIDVLKKPMKAEEVKNSQKRLLDSVAVVQPNTEHTWKNFKDATLEKVHEWAKQKKQETTQTITERATKKAEAEKERYIKGAKKAKEKNGMSDAEIEKNGQYQYDNVFKEEMKKLDSALAGIDAQEQVFVDALEMFSTDGVYAIPGNIYDLYSVAFEPGFGKLIDIKISDNFSVNASTLTFATLDGRRKITVSINGKVKQQKGEKRELFPVINSLTSWVRQGMYGSNVTNTLRVLEQNVDNWDRLTSTAARKEAHIITGNLLKALVSTREQGVGVKLISYTTDTGEVRQGILMPDNFEPAGLTSKTPISSKKDELKRVRDKVVSADGDVEIKVLGWDVMTHGFNTLELTVPKSKKRGEKYFNDEVLLSLMDGQFEGSGKMKAEFPRANLDAVMKRLDELGVTVTEEHNDDSPKRMITTSDPMEAISQAADSWRQRNGNPVVNNKLQEIADVVNMLSSRSDLKGSAPTYTINSRQDLEALEGKVSRRVYREIEKLYNDPDNGAAYIPRAGAVVIFGEHLEDAKEAEAAWWHEQTHSFWQKMPESVRRKFGESCLLWLRKNRPDLYHHITKPGNYPRYDWLNEACAFMLGNVIIEDVGTERFLTENFVGNQEICNFANELRNFIKNGRQGSTNAGNNQLRRISEAEQASAADVYGSNQQRGEWGDNLIRPEAEPELSEDPIEAIEQSAKLWRKQRKQREEELNAVENFSANAEYERRLNDARFVTSEAFQDAMLALKYLQNGIVKNGEILDSQNAYMQENLMHGKNAVEQEKFDATYGQPLLETIRGIMNATGMSFDDIERYLFTKSGLERNRELYVRDWLEAERRRHIGQYEDLNADEQRIFDQLAQRIEEDFDDGLIDKEEKDKRLTRALQKAHSDYLNSVEEEWNSLKDARYLDLQNGNSPSLGMVSYTYPDYLASLDKFIRANINHRYKAEKHDYSGLTALYGQDYSEADVIDELTGTEDKIDGTAVVQPYTEQLWEQIRAATRYGLERYREAGMRSDEQIDHIERMFHFYVPMRGFKEDMGEDVYQYFTSDGNDARHLGGLIRHAKGRKSEAFSPIATMFGMTYKAIADCNQNMVNQAFYRLCQSHKNDAVILSDSWLRLNEQTGEWEEDAPAIPEDASAEEVRQAVMAYEEEMHQLALDGKAMKVKGRQQFVHKPIEKSKQNEHVVEVRINGQPRKMYIVGNPRAAQALNGQTRFRKYDHWASKANSAIKDWMSKASTSYNLTFAARNMLRDWTHFETILVTREGNGYRHAASGYYHPFRMKSLFDKYRAGTLDESKEEERDFKDFMDNGGTTGYIHMMKLEKIQKDTLKQLEKMRKDGKLEIKLTSGLLSNALHAVEAWNEAIENAARFATYRASRHYAGRTKARSAYDAKEVTVNFNRKGAGRMTAGFKSANKNAERMAKFAGNASQLLNEGRMFFNATMQAVATIFKNFTNADGSPNWKYITRFAGVYASMPFGVAFLMPAINDALTGIGGGDDGDDPYANLPEWVRRKNFCLYLGWIPGIEKLVGGSEHSKFFRDMFLTIPIGQELAAFYSMGDLAASMTYAPNLKPVDFDLMGEFVSFLNVFSPVDFETKVTEKEGWASVVPEVLGRISTVIAPAVAVSENLSWTGRLIYREDKYQGDELIPEYQMVYNNTNGGFVLISKALNRVSGGTDVERGKAEINPGIMQYLLEQYTGGPGKLGTNTGSALHDLWDVAIHKGENADFNIRKVEIAKAFFQQADERTQFYRAKAKWRKYLKDANDLQTIIKRYEKDASENTLNRFRAEELQRGVAAARMYIVMREKDNLKKGEDAIRKLTGRERRDAQEAYNMYLKEVVDELDAVKDER